MLQKLFVPLIVALIAVLSIWLLPEQREQTLLPVNRSNLAADSFMENFTIHVLNAQGRPQYELRAVHMAHYPHDGHSDLQQPLFTAYQEEKGEQWMVSAERGVMENSNEKITLHGRVVIDKIRQNEQSDPLQIQTQELLILPPESYAETAEYALITQGDATMESNGLRAFFEENRIQLLSQVRGVYEARP